MLASIRSAAFALLLLTPVLSGQTIFFGEPAPQTHTRYGAEGARPRLVTDGRDFHLFWATGSKLRVTRLVDGQKRAGRPVLGGNELGQFDVVWTGVHFLLVADDLGPDGYRRIRGRLVNVHGEPIGAPFALVTEGDLPRLAFDGSRVLMTYRGNGAHSSMLLRPDGVPATAPHHQTLQFPSPLEHAVAHGGPGFVSAAAHPTGVRITTMRASSEFEDALQLSAPPAADRRIAVASSGTDVLAVWTNGGGAAEWVRVGASSGISHRSTFAGTNGAVDVAVAWNGTHWVVSTIAGGKLHTRFFDGVTSTEAHTPVKAHDASPVSLASLNTRTLAAWRGTGSGFPVLVRDLAGSGNGQDGAFAAAEQTLHTATWSHEAALAVWSETRDGKRTLHAGVRRVDGTWREDRIGSVEEATLASSDGTLFLVVKQAENGWSAVTLDNTAKILASTPINTRFRPTGITWDGTSWVVIGTAGGTKIYAARVKAWGEISAPVLIHERTGNRLLENPRIAAGGGGFLAIWQDSESTICFPVCDPYESELHGSRLTSSLQRVDTLHLELAEDEAVSPDLYWDGNRFQLFWLDDGALETRSLRPDAAGSGTTRIAGGQIDTGRIRAVQTPFGATITSDDGEVLLIRSGELIRRYSLGVPDSRDALVNLGPDVAYLQAQVRDEMPYHGASHVFLRTGGVIARDTMPLPPEITRAWMTNNGNRIVLSWAPPIDSINGYRIEYRVDDGVWNEFDEWFDAGTTSVSIVPWLDGVRYHFRLRAWSDAGVSEYSMPATVRLLGRRRAMR